jgi:hypothetical protein
MVGTKVDNDQHKAVSCGWGKLMLEAGKKKNPKVMRLLTKPRRLKHWEKPGFGKIAMLFNHQSFRRIRP